MRFRHCTPKIALALPVLGALMTPTLALPAPRNRYHPDKPLPSEVIRERVKNPSYRYAEVPVELKEGTAVPEPALISNHRFEDDEIIDRAYNHEVQPHHAVASATKDSYNASGNAETEENEAPHEIEDIAPIEKRDIFSDDEFEDDDSDLDEEYSHPLQKYTENQISRFPTFFNSHFKYGTEDWRGVWEDRDNRRERDEHREHDDERHEHREHDERPEHREHDEHHKHREHDEHHKHREHDEPHERCQHLKEAEVHAPYHKHIVKPTPPIKPHVPIPDHFDGYVEVPTAPKNTTTIKADPITTGDAPEYEIPVDLLLEALTDAEEEDPEKHIERRTMHRLTPLDIEADEPAPTVAPEAVVTQAQAPASLPEATHSSAAPFTDTGHVRIPRPVIQH